MGTPIRLSADFSTEILQARREKHDTLRAMKGKNLQPQTLYPERLSFTFDEEIKSFPDKQKLKRIQHHQTRFTTNAKGIPLNRKQKARKRPTESKPKTIRQTVTGSYILIITLNVNGLNAPTKRHRLAGQMKTGARMHFYSPHCSAWLPKLYAITLYC